MYSYTILVLVGLVAASNVKASCPDVQPVKDFNLSAYGNGVWYEVARYPNQAERSGVCGSAEYKLVDDVISVKNSHVAKNKLRSIKGSAKLAEDAGTTGKLLFSYPYGPSGATIKTVLWVLSTDYDNYSVAYYCKYNEEKKTRQDFAWVLSRTKTLNDAAKAAVDKVLQESSFLDANKLIWPDFSEEACRIEA